MLRESSVLLALVALIDRIPAPPAPPGGRGRPVVSRQGWDFGVVPGPVG
jgi:hypothetical protein